MNYIGSKNKLSSFIFDTVTGVTGGDISKKIFCDLFAGTSIIGQTFKPHVQQVISNDVEFYSYVLNRNYIGNNTALDAEGYLNTLNNLAPIKGFIFQNYAEGGSAGRNYFTAQNAQKIDAARQQIETWKTSAALTDDLYYLLVASLLESADRVANTASVYGAYLKQIKASAAKEIKITAANFIETKTSHHVFQQDSNLLISKIEGDILYMDPPYNARQYGANYHLLNTIAKYDTFAPKGKTGLREYYKSDYCKRGEVLKSFTEVIEKAQFKYIFLSYNNEGLMSQNNVKEVMERFGKYDVATTKYQRFKADKTQNRNHKADSTIEYLHILEKI
ncbi:DNA adenine methylase [Patiriisocius sp. Uisw_017]|jgi:adenine-specific DNA-methyltransferase|uniref:DNA adenine methylase n=1 Tax=Patiriisocius sp. Uisw_017 TaxID=3230968 RepID=UPI0039E8610D